MEKAFIDSTIRGYLEKQFFCNLSGLEESNTIFSINSASKSPYIKIMAVDKYVIVNTSKEIHTKVRAVLQDKSRDEIFEFPFVYGQTIHYIPDMKKIQRPVLPETYSYERLEGKDIDKVKGLKGFEHSVVFDYDGNTSTKIVFLAKKDGEIVGLAGAGEEADKLWEIGVDVKAQFRKGGLGTKLVSNLTVDIMEAGIVPFYSASVTNIGSQMVADRSGYIPYWIDTYSTILDGSSPYHDLVRKLEL